MSFGEGRCLKGIPNGGTGSWGTRQAHEVDVKLVTGKRVRKLKGFPAVLNSGYTV